MSRELRERNRLSWNAATRAHNSHKADQAGFLRRGGSTLHDEERELLGAIDGRRLLHLLCNAGQDTLSLARLGARVRGVDISDEAIDFARALAAAAGIDAAFERADVYDWLDEAAARDERYDRVFLSYGALPWLPDLDALARGAAAVLAEGGRLVVVEFHPVAAMFDEQWRPRFPYSSGGAPVEWAEGVGDYVEQAGSALTPSGYLAGEREFANPNPCYEYYWGLGDVVGAVLRAGLRLERLVEYPHSNGFRQGERMRELPGRRFLPPADVPVIPLMYGLVATRER